MSCVFKNSNDALTFLLCTLFSLDDEEDDRKLMNRILHEKNTKGDTLLGLLLNYEKEGSMSETIALQMEKICHTEAENRVKTMINLTACFKKHVEPSSNVLRAVQEVDESFKKTYFEKITIWFQLFLSSFIMPLGIMISDMSFDAILVAGYACWLYKMNTTEYTTCSDNLNCSFEDICSDLRSSRNDTANFLNLEKLNRDIPCKLLSPHVPS